MNENDSSSAASFGFKLLRITLSRSNWIIEIVSQIRSGQDVFKIVKARITRSRVWRKTVTKYLNIAT